MTTWLELLTPVRHVDEYGAERVTYEHHRLVHAERLKHSARGRDEIGEHFADHSTEYHIRIQHHPEEQWRAQEIGGHLYTITAIIPNRERGLQTLICERVNE